MASRACGFEHRAFHLVLIVFKDIMDERYVAVDVLGKGLVIFSACSHAGIVNVVRDAIAKFSRPVYMVRGGPFQK